MKIFVSTFITLALASQALAQTPIRAIEPYLGRLQDSNNFPIFSSDTRYFKWRLYAPGNDKPFPGAVKVSNTTYPYGTRPDCTRVVQGVAFTCVQFVRQVSNSPTVAASQWRRGRALVVNGVIRNDLSPGTIIATMDGAGGRYAPTNPHSAVFLRRINNNTIEVADQNVIGGQVGIVGLHWRINVYGSGYADARRYWSVTN